MFIATHTTDKDNSTEATRQYEELMTFIENDFSDEAQGVARTLAVTLRNVVASGHVIASGDGEREIDIHGAVCELLDGCFVLLVFKTPAGEIEHQHNVFSLTGQTL